MIKPLRGVLAIFALAALPLTLHAAEQSGWMLTTYVGQSGSLDMPFQMHVQNGEDVNKVAEWDNKPYSDSQYWGGRMEYWKQGKGQGFEIIHHKVYLANTDDYIQKFSISDGYNLAYYNRSSHINPSTIFRYGLGVVIAHPDVTVQGRGQWVRKGGEGLVIAGPSAQIAIEKWAAEWRHYILTMEAKFTASYARVPISKDPQEYAEVPDLAFHFTIGFGSKPIKKDAKITDYVLFWAPTFFPRATGTVFGLK